MSIQKKSPHKICTFRWEKGPRKGKRCSNWRRRGSEWCGAHDTAWRKKTAKKRRQAPKLPDALKKLRQAEREAAKIHEHADRKFIARVRWLVDGVAEGHLTREDAFDLIKKAM